MHDSAVAQALLTESTQVAGSGEHTMLCAVAAKAYQAVQQAMVASCPAVGAVVRLIVNMSLSHFVAGDQDLRQSIILRQT